MNDLELNHKLRQHTTQISFHLTMSRSMVTELRVVKMWDLLHKAGLVDWYWEQQQNGADLNPGVPNFIAAAHALEARGLIEIVPKEEWAKNFKKMRDKQYWATVTPAGERVWDLLVMAGVVQNIQLPANVPVKRRRASSGR